jgi:ABC-2 type transport system ATP-binding protein
LYDALTVEQSLEYFARAHYVPEAEVNDRVHETALRMNLLDKLTAPVQGLSRGMRQRLAIGQTIIQKPKYLILDEPASGLDPEARYALGEEFLRMHREGLTLIVSSHILAELDHYATDLLILREGKVVEHTSVAQLASERDVLEVTLSSSPDGLAETIGRMPNVQKVEVSGLHVSIEFDGDELAQQEILRSLVMSGLPVKEFFAKRVSLQDQYLEQVSQSS